MTKIEPPNYKAATFFIIMSLCGLLRAREPAEGLPRLNLSVLVKDEVGQYIEGAEVEVNFSTVNPQFGGEFHIIQNEISLHGVPSNFGERAIQTLTTASKNGYWPTLLLDRWLESRDVNTGDPLPEVHKQVEIVLRERRNPRPLYVHKVDSVFRENTLNLHLLDYKYGFDLMVGDFVRPHGRGTRADLFLTMTGEVNPETNEYDVLATLSFPNEGDGVILVERTLTGESTLLLGQEAPLDGYQPTFQMRSILRRDGAFLNRTVSPTDAEQRRWEGMWFRTHTELDPVTGEVLRARHGKIYALLDRVILFQFRPERHGHEMHFDMQFIYFYAPDDSRSLEFNEETLVPSGNIRGVNKR